MIGCLRTRVRKQPIIVLYYEFETVLKLYNPRVGFHCVPFSQGLAHFLFILYNIYICIIYLIALFIFSADTTTKEVSWTELMAGVLCINLVPTRMAGSKRLLR